MNNRRLSFTIGGAIAIVVLVSFIICSCCVVGAAAYLLLRPQPWGSTHPDAVLLGEILWTPILWSRRPRTTMSPPCDALRRCWLLIREIPNAVTSGHPLRGFQRDTPRVAIRRILTTQSARQGCQGL